MSDKSEKLKRDLEESKKMQDFLDSTGLSAGDTLTLLLNSVAAHLISTSMHLPVEMQQALDLLVVEKLKRMIIAVRSEVHGPAFADKLSEFIAEQERNHADH